VRFRVGLLNSLRKEPRRRIRDPVLRTDQSAQALRAAQRQKNVHLMASTLGKSSGRFGIFFAHVGSSSLTFLHFLDDASEKSPLIKKSLFLNECAWVEIVAVFSLARHRRRSMILRVVNGAMDGRTASKDSD
jgi:hypothetical protein